MVFVLDCNLQDVFLFVISPTSFVKEFWLYFGDSVLSETWKVCRDGFAPTLHCLVCYGSSAYFWTCASSSLIILIRFSIRFTWFSRRERIFLIRFVVNKSINFCRWFLCLGLEIPAIAARDVSLWLFLQIIIFSGRKLTTVKSQFSRRAQFCPRLDFIIR